MAPVRKLVNLGVALTRKTGCRLTLGKLHQMLAALLQQPAIGRAVIGVLQIKESGHESGRQGGTTEAAFKMHAK